MMFLDDGQVVFGEDDSVAVLRIAPEASRCDECQGDVEAGEFIDVAYSLDDPSAWQCLSCMSCRHDRQFLRSQTDTWYYHALDEQLLSEWDANPSLTLGRIICRRRHEHRQLMDLQHPTFGVLA